MTETVQELTEALRQANEAHAREQWLKERQRGIGASEVAAIIGVDPRRGQCALYAEKIGALVREDNPYMRWGRKAEALTAEAYGQETGRPVSDPPGGLYHIVYSDPLSVLGATLDRVTQPSEACPAPIAITHPAETYAPLECKVVAGWIGDRWAEEPPLEYQVQLQIQMLCTGARWGSLAALIGWPPRPVWVDFERNDRFLAAALPRVEEFWQRVVDRRPPDPDPPVSASAAAVRALWPADTGETITLPVDTLELVDRWQHAKARKSAADGEAEEIENQLRARMRDATTGTLSDGTALVLKTTSVKAYTVEHEAKKYRTLRHYVPKPASRRKKKA